MRTYLVDTLGVADMDVAVRGAGESEPAASNDTAEGRCQNRRVEFIF
jgi:OOP family OmpA-OmpF porin